MLCNRDSGPFFVTHFYTYYLSKLQRTIYFLGFSKIPDRLSLFATDGAIHLQSLASQRVRKRRSMYLDFTSADRRSSKWRITLRKMESHSKCQVRNVHIIYALLLPIKLFFILLFSLPN